MSEATPELAAVPTQCQCATATCRPEDNEGAYCWRSGCYIPKGYFSSPSADAVGVNEP